jgi:hypothetical protein
MNNRIVYILLFLVSTAACVGILMSPYIEWFWLTLPFVILGLIKSFDAI